MSGCNTAAAALLTLAAAACSKQLAGPAPQRPALAQAYRASGHMAAGDVFVDMVNRCNAAGVGIIADAVINHMTNYPSPGVGSNGTAYTKYNYPGLYSVSDFHTPCEVNNYQSAANVQDCELLSLPDLNTGLAPVRQKIADYLLSLAHLGVAGFRIDAAKHIQQVELDDIFARVNNTLTAEGRSPPYVFLEVIGGSGEALSPRDYFGEGYSSGGAADITEFTFTGVGNKFRGVNGEHISQLNPNGTAGNQFSETAWGLMPSDKAVVFIENHDTQHQCGLSYRDGIVFRLANVWMLAQPYGYPSILSSYAFYCLAGNSMGPPSDANGWTVAVTCASSLETATIGQWVCEHRDGAVVDTTIATGMPPGTYCDILTGGLIAAACAGDSVAVDPAGAIHFHLASNTVLAIDAATKRP